VKEPCYRSVQVWHALTRDHTEPNLTRTHLCTNGVNHTCFCLPSRSWASFTDAGGFEKLSWPIGTTMVSKQSAQDRYVTEITVVSCSDRHALLGNWSAGAVSVELTTSRAASRDADH